MINALKVFLIISVTVIMVSMSQAPQATTSTNSISALTSYDNVFDVQVNRLPHPFNLNGSLPFQVWVDGERMPLNDDRAKKIIKILDLNFTQPTDPKLHSGVGWMFPYETRDNIFINRIQNIQ